jgi:hypothetical protein
MLNLDDDVCGILPELKDLPIMTGFKEPTDEPILQRNNVPITLR